jgi:hypothetical protein
MRTKFRALTFAVALVALAPALTITSAGAAAKQTVSIKLGASSVKTGQTTHVTGKVAPAASGKAIKLQRYYGKAWHGFQAKKLTSKSTYDFAVKMTKAGAYTFRAVAPTAVSKSVKLTVTAARTPTPPRPPPISPR